MAKEKGFFKKSKEEEPVEEAEPTLQEQMVELEEKINTNAEAWELADSEIRRVRSNIDSESTFIESDIKQMKKEHQGSAKSFLDKLLKKRVSDSTHATQTAKKLEAHLRVLRVEQNTLRRDRERLQKLIEETADREAAGEVVELFDKMVELLSGQVYPIFSQLKELLRTQPDRGILAKHITGTYKKPGVYVHILNSRMKPEYLNRFSLAAFCEALMQMKLDAPGDKPLLDVDYAEFTGNKHITEEAFLVGDSYAIERKPA